MQTDPSKEWDALLPASNLRRPRAIDSRNPFLWQAREQKRSRATARRSGPADSRPCMRSCPPPAATVILVRKRSHPSRVHSKPPHGAGQAHGSPLKPALKFRSRSRDFKAFRCHPERYPPCVQLPSILPTSLQQYTSGSTPNTPNELSIRRQ